MLEQGKFSAASEAKSGRILVDSGAALNVCPVRHAEENELVQDEATQTQLRTATGNQAKIYGRRNVKYDTGVGQVSTNYTVANVHKTIWSVGKWTDNGGEVHFGPHGAWMTTKDGRRLELEKENGVYFVGVRLAKTPCGDPLLLTPLEVDEGRHPDASSSTSPMPNPVLPEQVWPGLPHFDIEAA